MTEEETVLDPVIDLHERMEELGLYETDIGEEPFGPEKEATESIKVVKEVRDPALQKKFRKQVIGIKCALSLVKIVESFWKQLILFGGEKEVSQLIMVLLYVLMCIAYSIYISYLLIQRIVIYITP
jgi:hypothetical protein